MNPDGCTHRFFTLKDLSMVDMVDMTDVFLVKGCKPMSVIIWTNALCGIDSDVDKAWSRNCCAVDVIGYHVILCPKIGYNR